MVAPPGGDIYTKLAAELQDKAADRQQFWVAIAGGPGSGKSTLARTLCDMIGDDAIVLPMDGFHFTRAELELLEDPELAHARRGAPFTFDGARFKERVQTLHGGGEGSWPSFCHTVGDPVQDEINLERRHRIVIVEGNYVLLDEPPWSDVRACFDETWFVHVEEDVARERTALRHAMAWGWPLERAYDRVDSNDLPNMRLVEETKVHASRVIDSSQLPAPPGVVVGGQSRGVIHYDDVPGHE